VRCDDTVRRFDRKVTETKTQGFVWYPVITRQFYGWDQHHCYAIPGCDMSRSFSTCRLQSADHNVKYTKTFTHLLYLLIFTVTLTLLPKAE